MDSEIIKFKGKISQASLETIIANSTKEMKEPKMIEQVSNHIKRIFCDDQLIVDWQKITNLRKNDFINKAIESLKLASSSYLEIGVYRNLNFNMINANDKISVDPDPNAYPSFLGSSNEFFAENKKKFDVIFIDGMHSYEQCKFDAINSLKYLNTGGYLFLHDLIPRNFLEEYIPRISNVWTGDVWKVSIELAQTKGVQFKVILADHGLGCLKKIDENVNYYHDNKNDLVFKKYKDFFELNKLVKYEGAEAALKSF